MRKTLKTCLQNNDSSCRARHDAHRGRYVNTVLPVVQEGEYVARRVGRTHAAVGQQLEARSSVRRGDGGLQGEGSKVEKQSQEMVKDILRRGKGLIVFLYVCFIYNMNRCSAVAHSQQKGQKCASHE